MKLRNSIEIQEVLLHVARTPAKLTVSDLRVFLAWMTDSKAFNSNQIQIGKKLEMLPCNVSRSFSNLVKAGILKKIRFVQAGKHTVPIYSWGDKLDPILLAVRKKAITKLKISNPIGGENYNPMTGEYDFES